MIRDKSRVKWVEPAFGESFQPKKGEQSLTLVFTAPRTDFHRNSDQKIYAHCDDTEDTLRWNLTHAYMHLSVIHDELRDRFGFKRSMITSIKNADGTSLANEFRLYKDGEVIHIKINKF